jgi:hypothetical protein
VFEGSLPWGYGSAGGAGADGLPYDGVALFVLVDPVRQLILGGQIDARVVTASFEGGELADRGQVLPLDR